jgi:UDP-N-acetylmuramate dehydrogenase
MSPRNPRAEGGYALFEDAELAPLTTFRVSARAALLAELYDTAALGGLLERLEPTCRERLFVLGGGSNVLFIRDFPGIVLRLATRGIEALDEREGRVRLRVAAGENWDALVRWSLAHGLAGLENLIFIPGTVGAAPIQNIGAYGVELAEFVHAVEAWDFACGARVRLAAEECGFAYRNSRFKREPGRFLVTTVELKLSRERELCLDYAGIRAELSAMGIDRPTHTDVGQAVERLRRRKLPDPAEIGNAGSFFKNPVIAEAKARALKQTHPALPIYPVGGGKAKLSAAWLIEACGFKGWREGDVGVSEKHALVLVNYGSATGADILALAEGIRAAVAARFAVTLEPEPKVL